MEGKNRNARKQITAIFLNHPEESFTYRQILERSGLPEGTVKSRLKRLCKKKIIRRYKKVYGGLYHYKLYDRHKGLSYVEGREKREKSSSEDEADTPTHTERDYLAGEITQAVHHQVQSVKLTPDEWKRTEHLYSQPTSDKDRGRQRVFTTKTFKLVISPQTLRGAFYILEDGWEGELNKYYPELTKEIIAKKKFDHMGVSIDTELWKNFRLASEDLKVLFGNSHFLNELDAEGKSEAVNSFLQHLVRDSFDKTTYEARIVKILDELMLRADGSDERAVQMLAVMHKMSETIEKHSIANEKIAELLSKLIGEDKDKPKPEPEMKDLSDTDWVMYG